jgi:plastocyanin
MRLKDVGTIGLTLFAVSACGGGGGGSSSEYGSAPSGTASAAAAMSNSTAANAAPSFIDFQQSVAVNENQTSIVTVRATDADSDDLTFSLTGSDADALSIDSASGALSFLSAPDYEVKSSYQAQIVVSDGYTSTSQAVTIAIVDIAESSAEAPLEINLTVASGSNGYGGGNKYYINGSVSPDITLEAGKTYRFLQSDGSNATHPVRLSATENGMHEGGSDYTESVEYVSTAGGSGAYLQITLPASGAPETLYYYCQNHSGMGGRIFVTAASGTDYRVVSMN